MTHINVAAYVDGIPPATKAALKRAVADDPHRVRVLSTSPLGQVYDGPLPGAPEDTTLVASGPDPFNDRRWWANIKKQGGTYKVT